MIDYDLVIKNSEVYRAASRGFGLSTQNRDLLVSLDEQECLKLLSDPVQTLVWATEKMGKGLAPDAPQNSVLFAVRCAVQAMKKVNAK